MFTAQALKRYVTSTRIFRTFHDFLPISHALLFPALSESCIFFLPLGVGKSAGRKSEKETLAFLGLAAKASDTKQHRLKLQLG